MASAGVRSTTVEQQPPPSQTDSLRPDIDWTGVDSLKDKLDKLSLEAVLPLALSAEIVDRADQRAQHQAHPPVQLFKVKLSQGIMLAKQGNEAFAVGLRGQRPRRA